MLRSIRASRATPPVLAGQDPTRGGLYAASLEQFEQLLNAARVTGPAARPLPLFYALSQAGRAIVAAHGQDLHVEGHGLTEDRVNPAPGDLLHRKVKRFPAKHGRDAFGAVSRAIASPDLVDQVELGAVWAALPNTYPIPGRSWRPDWRTPLDVLDDGALTSQPGQARVQVASMAGNPHLDPAATLRERYPSLPEGTRIQVTTGSEALGAGNWVAVLTWSAGHDLDAIAPLEDRLARSSRHLLPTLPGQGGHLQPLMMWWLLLFGLSIFARYHPGLWASALDVDHSEHAVPLEAVLDRALEAVPLLVHQALLS